MTQNPHNEDSEELFHKEDLKETSLEDKLKGAFSPEEMDKINSKQVPSFADVKPKEKSSKAKKEMDKFLNKIIAKHGTTEY